MHRIFCGVYSDKREIVLHMQSVSIRYLFTSFQAVYDEREKHKRLLKHYNVLNTEYITTTKSA